MAKKKSTAKKVEDRSVRANMSALIGVCACVAIVLAIIIFFVNMILQLLDVNGGRAMGILNLIKDITLALRYVFRHTTMQEERSNGLRPWYLPA